MILDEPCDYCQNGKPLWESRVESIRIGNHPQTKRPSLKIGNRFNMEIECCPKCGRRLEGK